MADTQVSIQPVKIIQSNRLRISHSFGIKTTQQETGVQKSYVSTPLEKWAEQFFLDRPVSFLVLCSTLHETLPPHLVSPANTPPPSLM